MIVLTTTQRAQSIGTGELQMQFNRVEAQVTLRLRHSILWTTKNICDADVRLGAFFPNQAVLAALYFKDPICEVKFTRIRPFSSENSPEKLYQCKGIRSLFLDYALRIARSIDTNGVLLRYDAVTTTDVMVGTD